MIPRRRFARGRIPKQPGQMNRLETAYALELDRLKATGAIAAYRYEGLKLRLADKTFLTPDFLVVAADYTLELHETKGFMQDDAAVKLKVAADQYPWFRFLLVKAKAKRDGGGWSIAEVGA